DFVYRIELGRQRVILVQRIAADALDSLAGDGRKLRQIVGEDFSLHSRIPELPDMFRRALYRFVVSTSGEVCGDLVSHAAQTRAAIGVMDLAHSAGSTCAMRRERSDSSA